ncbi:putative glutamine amidotransferase-like protein [Lachnellula arida]|uniref:Putative glutamine amidotransferase-like protein n=1 Tax=Lachnellula arida TaxID=1316785 RepID=A0A8T9B2C9_9HELO|nr:putative glutamine amidotransferase-like protein [Lachnellula arida]
MASKVGSLGPGKKSCLRIAILDCDTPVPNVYSERGLYSDIFAALLRDAASTSPELSELKLEFSKYDSVLGQFPSLEEFPTLNGVIITGSGMFIYSRAPKAKTWIMEQSRKSEKTKPVLNISTAASAYDDAPWITSLTDFCRRIYTSYPSIKIFGSCFGHQLLCHVLFSPPGKNVVCRDPKGWELGVHPTTLSSAFISNFGPVTSNPLHADQLRLQFVHADHVDLPGLSEGFHSIGSSQHCSLQGVWKKGRVLTYQGHAEFDGFVNGETVKVFGKAVWDQTFMEESLKAVDGEDDSIWAAQVMLRFFMEEETEERKCIGRRFELGG